MGRASGRGI